MALCPSLEMQQSLSRSKELVFSEPLWKPWRELIVLQHEGLIKQRQFAAAIGNIGYGTKTAARQLSGFKGDAFDLSLAALNRHATALLG